MKENKLLEILNEIEEEAREELRYSSFEAEEQHAYGMMDAVMQIKKKLNMEN